MCGCHVAAGSSHSIALEWTALAIQPQMRQAVPVRSHASRQYQCREYLERHRGRLSFEQVSSQPSVVRRAAESGASVYTHAAFVVIGMARAIVSKRESAVHVHRRTCSALPNQNRCWHRRWSWCWHCPCRGARRAVRHRSRPRGRCRTRRSVAASRTVGGIRFALDVAFRDLQPADPPVPIAVFRDCRVCSNRLRW
jgi:hypothetical protein